MNRPRVTGKGGSNREDRESNAKWADLVKAMRDADMAAGPGTADSAQGEGTEPMSAPEPQMTPPAGSPTPPPPFQALLEDVPVEDYVEADEVDTDSRRWVIGGILFALGSIWLAFAAWILLPQQPPLHSDQLLLMIAAVGTPVLLIGLLAAILLRSRPDPDRMMQARSGMLSAEARSALSYLSVAEERLANTYAVLQRHANAAAAIADDSAEAVLAAARRVQVQAGEAESALRGSGAAAADALALVRAIEESTPELDARLSALTLSLTHGSAALISESTTLEERLRGAAAAAEDVRAQMSDTHDAALNRIEGLGTAARATGDELTAMADLASARVELVLDRARNAMSIARAGLEEHMASLTALGEQGERSAAKVKSLGVSTTEIGQQLSTLEQQADTGKARIADHLGVLGVQAERVGGALQQSNAGAAQLVERMEALLLALDSNIREIDESLPAALGRFDTRLSATEARLAQAAGSVEGMAGTADLAARHLEQASETLVEQSRAVEASISAGDASLARHTAEITAMRALLDESAALMTRLVETGAPQIVAASERVRDESLAATARAEEAISAVAARASQMLAEASSSALDAAVSEKVNAQIAQIAEIADNAVKSAHRATDHLMREMMAIADTASDLEQRMAQARQVEETRGRDHVAERSSQIIAALGDSAIDVTRWFAQDIGQREWSAYLGGDKSLFARRAVKLVSSSDMKQLHARYEIDEQFRDHVNRYVEDFERMLAEVLEARRGHALAIALLSSDLGKLYVALAQAIERLRVG